MADMASALSLSLSSLRLWPLRRSSIVLINACGGLVRSHCNCSLAFLPRQEDPWSESGRGRVIGRRGDVGRAGPLKGAHFRRAVCVGRETMGVEEAVRAVEVADSIRLTEQEEKIFDVLIATLKHFELDTELRVAGGWVRDKVNRLSQFAWI
jgi:hypothetical protein